MLSIIIPTRESERLLVRTLASLVPGATGGLVREVILADAGSTDETAEVGDVAGCRFLPFPGPLGPRLAFAATSAKSEWLMLVRPGAVLDAGWVGEVSQFIEQAPERVAAAFAINQRPHGQSSLLREWLAVWHARRAPLDPDHGLVIAKPFYRELGGHADVPDAERDLLRRIGKRRIAALRSGITLTK